MLCVEWEGRTKDIPAKYKTRPIPDDVEFCVIYTNGSRTYHHGLDPDQSTIDRINWVMSRCWDSLPDNEKIRINSLYD